MNISSAFPSVAANPVVEVASAVAAPAAAPTTGTSEIGPAMTWWISPPGQYFSVLNQISQEYPIELRLALQHFAEAASRTAAAPGEETMASIASEVAHGTQPTRRRAPPAAVTYAPTASAPQVSPSPAAASGVNGLLQTMQRLAHDAPAVFQDISYGLASSFQSVAEGSGGLAMSTLAAQLQQAATLVTGEPRARSSPPVGPDVPIPVVAVAGVAVIEGEAADPSTTGGR